MAVVTWEQPPETMTLVSRSVPVPVKPLNQLESFANGTGQIGAVVLELELLIGSLYKRGDSDV